MLSDANRLSRILAWIYLVGLAILPLGIGWLILNLEWVVHHPPLVTLMPASIMDGLPLPETFSIESRLAVLTACALPAGLTAAVLWNLSRFFSGLARGAIFTPESVRRIRRVGLCMLVRVCAAPFTGALMTLALTLDNPPGQHMISLSMDSKDLSELITALTLLVAARVLDQGRALHEDAQLVI